MSQLALLLGVGVLLIHAIQLFQLASRESAHWGIVFSKDNDSAHAVELYPQTSFFNPDPGGVYGALYLRLTHIVGWLDPLVMIPKLPRPQLVLERSGHFAFMAVSVVSFLGLMCLLGYAAGNNTLQRIAATLLFTFVFSSDPVWMHFILQAKPDLLLHLLVGLAIYSTIRMVEGNAQQKRWAYFAAIAWGLCLSTKFNCFPFLLGLGVLWIPAVRRQSPPLRFVQFCFWVGVAYLFSGFPITIRPAWYQFLFFIQKTQFGGAHTWATRLAYVREFFTPWIGPVGVAAITTFLFGLAGPYEKGGVPRKPQWILSVLPLMPLLYMLRYRFQAESSHHFIISVAPATLLTTVYVRYFVQKLERRVFQWFGLLLCIGIVVFVLGARPITRSWATGFQKRYECREESESVATAIADFLASGESVVADGYVPYDSQSAGKGLRPVWGMDLNRLEKHVTVFVTKRAFYVRYLYSLSGGVPSEWVMLDHKHNWREIGEFYERLDRGTPFRDLHGRQWMLKTKTQCGGWEIWKRK